MVEAKLTGRPDDAVADIVNGAAPKTVLAMAENVMVCMLDVTLKLLLTGAAAL